MTWTQEDFRDLDNPATYAVDSSGVYSWLEKFDRKLDAGREAYIGKISLPSDRLGHIHEVIISGMGGSAIAGEIAYALAVNSLPVPCRILRGYQLPLSLDEHTLLLLVSYSGSTEEVVWTYSQGHNRGAKCIAISSGGAIREMAERFGCPHIRLPADYPAPRLALGHILPAVLGVLAAVFGGAEEINESLEDAVLAVKRGVKRYERELPFEKNFAKRLAYDIGSAFPVIIASEGTWPAALRFQAQINENGKWPCHAAMLPEMNHNEIVAYTQAGPAVKRTGILMLRDKGDHPRVQFRQDFTLDMAGKYVAWTHQLKGEGKTPLGRILSMMQTADFASYYLACARGIDPLNIKSIDILKERLGKLQ